MTLRSRRRCDGDNGAYAVLYAVVIIMIVVVTGLVVDIGNARMDRTANRSASDSAAIAGAAELGLGGSNPLHACETALEYAKQTLGGATDTSVSGITNVPCSSAFGDSVPTMCTAGGVRTAIQAVTLRGQVKIVQVSWPVPNDSPLLTEPDMERRSSNSGQQVQPAVGSDGAPCLRVAVQILQTRAFLFGQGRTTTESKSVALAVPRPGPGEIAAPLVILDPNACSALDASGGGSPFLTGGVEVTASDPFLDDEGVTVQTPGVIAVDSDGRAGLPDGPDPLAWDETTDCNGNGPNNNTIYVANNNKVWTLDGTHAPGYITSQAVTINNEDHDFYGNTTGCPLSGSWTPPALTPPNLCRIPQPGQPVTDRPWQHRYNCSSSDPRYTQYINLPIACTDPEPPKLPFPPGPRDYVDQWERYAHTSYVRTWGCVALNDPPGSGCTGPGPAGTYRIGPANSGSLVDGSRLQCGISTNRVISGNVYVDCDELRISNTAIVQFLGSVVTKDDPLRSDLETVAGQNVGSVYVSNSACILINDTDVTHCINRPPDVDKTSPPPDGGNVYIGGNLTLQSNNAKWVASQVFVFVDRRFQSNATGVVSWVAPYGESCLPGNVLPTGPAPLLPTAPTAGCFNSLALWTPYFEGQGGATQDFLTGGGELNIDGTLFMPYAAFKYQGDGANFQTRAQLVTRLLTVGGASALRMRPDASRSTEIPAGAGQLIR